MVRFSRAVLWLVALVACPGTAESDIRVRVTDCCSPGCSTESDLLTPLPAGSPVTITGESLGATVCQVRIFADAGENIGAITLSGNVSPSRTIRVLISIDSSFPALPADSRNPGCVQWAGFATVSQSFSANMSLACYVSGDITGPVAAAEVFAVSCGGSLNGTVTSTRQDGTHLGVRAIGQVSAAQILQAVAADPSNGTPASIESVLATGSTAGIAAPVRATGGSIRAITATASRIGPQSGDPIAIEAKSGITTVTAQSINAAIRANLGGNGTIQSIIATSGNISGSIRAAGLVSGTANNGIGIEAQGAAPGATQGNINASIHIEGSVLQHIRAQREISNDITITGSCFGRIEAWAGFALGADIQIDGNLTDSIIAGRERFSSIAPSCLSILKGYHLRNVTIGGSVVCGGPRIGGAGICPVGTFIEARGGTIGNVTVNGSISPDTGGNTPLRIFANSIGDVSVLGTAPNTAGDCFAVIGTGLRNECVPNSLNPSRDWQDYGGDPALVGSVSVAGDLAGRFLFSNAPSIVVGGKCMAAIEYGAQAEVGEPLTGSSSAARVHFGGDFTGLLRAPRDMALTGQVVVNGANDSTADFAGVMAFGNTRTTQQVCPLGALEALGDAPLVWPVGGAYGYAYGDPDSDLGLGAVGMVPAKLHVARCIPSADAGFVPDSSPPMLESEFTGRWEGHAKDVVLTFYLPIWTNLTAADESPLQLEFVKYVTNWEWRVPIDEGRYSVDVPRGASQSIADSRSIAVRGKPEFPLPAGLYRITLNPARPATLLSGLHDAAVEEAVEVAPFEYYFVLAADCNHDGLPDLPEQCDSCGPHCLYADFDQDGGVTGDDVTAYFDAWSAGAPSADVNQDGGVDGSDVGKFFCYWESGGCTL